MRNLSDTLERLQRFRRMNPSAVRMPGQALGFPPSRLSALPSFGKNPGALAASIYVPENLPPHPALVVVLHGCTQTAAGYDAGTGWSHLADRCGFVLLFPEQTRANNPNGCFNWFMPGDARRDLGEALSIREMIRTVVSEQGIDPDRIFITGLSAGGAMASVMLATYPEVFAGGAIIGGLAYGSAWTIPEAFDRMRGHGGPSDAELQSLLAGASEHDGPWPKISIWHGSADRTVEPANAHAIIAQWSRVHDLASADVTETIVDGYPRRAWSHDGREVLEEFTITGMGHGTPISGIGDAPLGHAGPYILDAAISSSEHIAAFWGLASQPIDLHTRPSRETRQQVEVMPRPRQATSQKHTPQLNHPTSGIKGIIEDALRRAGLM